METIKHFEYTVIIGSIFENGPPLMTPKLGGCIWRGEH